MADMKKVYNHLIIIDLYCDTKITHQSDLTPIEIKDLNDMQFLGYCRYLEL